ncbi:hypothetical protein B9Z19DRAFT_1128629 [Tuber borchii]|uniref:Uncharacterized protein n=1 Tax=Tuber borchii TaxID=42251 RepID=A0A2T6ZNV8_TUBBO|nr:hypothetical protein B9Z19DRAFT_1128629 [Tuber borchii]
MVAAAYIPHPYQPEVFAQLHNIDEAYRRLEEKTVSKEMLGEVRSLFIRYGVHRTLGIMVLHKHFDMTPEEKLVEFGNVSTPWLVPEANGDSVFGGKVVPRSWAFSSGHLYPIEFGFNPPTVENFPKMSFDQDFVVGLYGLLVGLGIGDLVGLTMLREDIHDMPYGIEKTVGRVSITLPITPETEPTQAVESVWTFGCHERMDNSKLWPARICWVCQDCKK